MFAKLKMFLGFGEGGEIPQKERVNPQQIAYEKLKAFRGMGQTFNYLGRTCIVTGHSQVYRGEFFSVRPCLVCDYADDLGVIHEIEFSASELPGLIAQQP